MKRMGVWCEILHHQSVDEYVALVESGLANDFIVYLVGPNQDAIDKNIAHLPLYKPRLEALGANFYCWTWCGEEDPAGDGRASMRAMRDLELAGVVANAESAYMNDGFRRSQLFLDALGPMPKGSLAVSPNATPAFRALFDYRRWELAGALYLPQCYWHEFGVEAYPEYLVRAAYLPEQVHVGWNYRLWIRGAEPRWSLVLDDYGDRILLRDLKTRIKYTTPVERRDGQLYPTTRILTGNGSLNAGKILGFFARDRILPVMPTYEFMGKDPSPAENGLLLAEAKVKKASVYLGERAVRDDFVAIEGALR